MKKTTISLIVLALALPLSQANASTPSVVNWQAANDNGIADASGTALATGDLVMIGGFNISNAAIAASITSSSALQVMLSADFTPLGTSTIGTNVGSYGGYWADSAIGLTDTSTPFVLKGLPIYILAFNASTVATATQVGIFTSNLSTWVFPSDAAFPFNTTNIDLDEASHTPVFGGYGVGTTPPAAIADGVGAAPMYNTAIIVPEPSTWAGLAGGMALVGAWIARRRKA